MFNTLLCLFWYLLIFMFYLYMGKVFNPIKCMSCFYQILKTGFESTVRHQCVPEQDT